MTKLNIHVHFKIAEDFSSQVPNISTSNDVLGRFIYTVPQINASFCEEVGLEAVDSVHVGEKVLC